VAKVAKVAKAKKITRQNHPIIIIGLGNFSPFDFWGIISALAAN